MLLRARKIGKPRESRIHEKKLVRVRRSLREPGNLQKKPGGEFRELFRWIDESMN